MLRQSAEPAEPVEPTITRMRYQWQEISLGFYMRRMPGYGRAETYTDVEPEDL